jgi:hypothetical protein
MRRIARQEPVAEASLSTVQAGRGVIRCFIESAELRRLFANLAAAELAGAIVRAALPCSPARALTRS